MYLYPTTNTMIMKRITSMLVLLLALCTLFGQEIPGTWTGKLSTPNGELTVNFNISATDDGYTSTLDSPDQNAYGIPCDSTGRRGGEHRT